ncbi:MAG: 4-(cytidine 5'-diphospho)-2-C-methyl-D-erythritol kinase [Bacteroidetes bacterium]|nr:4-(cytidine 5'-diphospho)-2-C-methyl-D-erythritol kinase [Bacteroidota bacterium]
MIIFAPAKINLGLAVHGKRPDGFHELTSIFYPIPLYDVLEILPSIEFEIEVIGLEIAGNMEDNLIWRAFHLMKREFEIDNVRVILQKNIPMGAGLGGGSSDASHLLKGLNDFFNLNISAVKLEELSAELGSDCPFFIESKPKLVKGRGEVLLKCDVNLSGYYLQLIQPGISVGTKEAFAGIKPLERKSIEMEWFNAHPSEWNGTMKNDFEETVFRQYPVLSQWKQKLYNNGAMYASMSGSGSTLFGLFETEPSSLHPESGKEWIFELTNHLF